MTSTSTGMVRMQSFPFDSKADGYDADGYPVYDRAVGASMLRETFAKFFTNGVFPSPGEAFLISKASSGLAVTVNPGIAIINGAMGGIEGSEPIALTLDTAAPQGNTAYAIMLRYDNTDDKRSLYFNVVKGDAASTATPPEPDHTTPSVYELRLGYVSVPSNASDLSAATVVNEKGTSVCPYAAPFEEIDVDAIVYDTKQRAQEALSALFEYFEQNKELVDSALDDTTAGYLQEQINELQEEVGNVDLSSQVDGKTIEFTAKTGESTSKLRAVVDEQGGVASFFSVQNVTGDLASIAYEFHRDQLEGMDFDSIVTFEFPADVESSVGLWDESGKKYYAERGTV